MTPSPDLFSQIKIELNIRHTRGLLVNPGSSLFVRYHLRLDGSQRTIRVETRDSTASASDRGPHWDDTAMLECQGSAGRVLPPLLQGNCGVTFELHQRRRRPGTFLRRLGKSSRLLGKGEVAWSEVLGSPGFVIERWIPVDAGASGCGDGNPPALLVGIRIVADGVGDRYIKQAMGRANTKPGALPESFCCEQCRWVAGEEDMFTAALASALVFDDF